MTETQNPGYELHQHTEISNPWEWFNVPSLLAMMQANLDAGLAGGLKTDHNSLAGTDTWLELAAKNDFITSPAVEINTTTDNTKRSPHLIAVLPEWRPTSQEIPYFEPVETTLKKLRDLGAFIIIPHPVTDFQKQLPLLNGFSFNYTEVAELAKKQLIDAVEVTTPLVALAHPLLTVLHQFNILPVGASDAHMLEQVGDIRTHIPGKHTTIFEALQYGKAHANQVTIESRLNLLKLTQMVPTIAHRWLIKQLAEQPREPVPQNS